MINPVAVASMLVYVIAASVALYFIYLFIFAGLTRKERARLLVCFILLISAAFFWSAFEQKPTSFNLFANDYTNRMIGDFEIPAVWFQSINALFIILLAPVFSWAWPKLATMNIRPSSITKFVIGILCAAAGFGLMMLAAQNVLSNGGAGVSPFWLVGSILMLTLGELCLSPIGLATMTLLAPERMRGQMMGLWFCASALGNGCRSDWRPREGRPAGYVAGSLRALLHRAADLCCGTDRSHCAGSSHAGKCPDETCHRGGIIDPPGRPFRPGNLLKELLCRSPVQPAMPSWSRKTAWLTANTVIKILRSKPAARSAISHSGIKGLRCGGLFLPERPRPDL